MTTAFEPQGEQTSSKPATGQQEAQGAEQQSAERQEGMQKQGSAEGKPSKRRELIARSRARVGHTVERVGHALERPAQRLGGALQRPLIGASVAGGLVAAAAGLWGATEAALGAFVGVLAYRGLKRRWRDKGSARQESEAARASEPRGGPTPAVAG